MKKKLKILVVTEFSELATGFSTYMHYLLPRLHKTGKYEIAELATYVDQFHPKLDNVPWKVYPNGPHPQNEREKQAYAADRNNVFGKWKFDHVCLDFQPDIVIQMKDPWMGIEWINGSVYREHFKFAHLATCDGEPQKSPWLEQYAKCDYLLTQSSWAKNLLEKQSAGQLKVEAVASPGTDINTFRPMDKQKVREKYGLNPNSKVIFTVMRNQPRKLFPDLFKAFAEFLSLCEKNKNDLYKDTILLCHTSWPDVGWDIPAELQRYKVSNKVYFTYICAACQHHFVTPYRGINCNCPRCQKNAAQLPNTVAGLDRESLAEVTNLGDVYVQYSISEGFGMPQVDAKACGLPVMAVYSSAMADQAVNGGGIAINVEKFFQEPINGTSQLRALPDNKDFVNKLYALLSDSEYLNHMSQEARSCALKYYDWDIIAEIWQSLLDKVPHSVSWTRPPKKLVLPETLPDNLNNYDFVKFCFINILQKPELVNSKDFHTLVHGLGVGYVFNEDVYGNLTKTPIDRNAIINNFVERIKQHTQADQYRYNVVVQSKNKNAADIGYLEV